MLSNKKQHAWKQPIKRRPCLHVWMCEWYSTRRHPSYEAQTQDVSQVNRMWPKSGCLQVAVTHVRNVGPSRKCTNSPVDVVSMDTLHVTEVVFWCVVRRSQTIVPDVIDPFKSLRLVIFIVTDKIHTGLPTQATYNTTATYWLTTVYYYTCTSSIMLYALSLYITVNQLHFNNWKIYSLFTKFLYFLFVS